MRGFGWEGVCAGEDRTVCDPREELPGRQRGGGGFSFLLLLLLLLLCHLLLLLLLPPLLLLGRHVG